jgi:AAA domain
LRLVVIDTLAMAAVGADEISGKDMGLVLSNIDRINAATGAHVCLVTHLNAGGSKIRGHTSIEANADTVITIVTDPQTKVRTVKLEKQKDGEAGLTMQFELIGVRLGETVRGKPITSCACLPVGEKEAIKRVEESKGYVLYGAERDFMRVFFEVENIQGQPVPPDMVAPAGVRSIVKHAAFQAELERQTPPLHVPSEDASDEEKAEANRLHTDRIKKHVKRMGEKLRGFGIVGNAKHGDTWWMWWTGKPLRGFPHTQPRERARPQPEPDPELREPDIPF